MHSNEDLLNFILEYFRIKDKWKLIPLTRLEEDLGIYGDIAEDFLWAYSDRFLVDISDFNFSKYLTIESFWGYYFIAKWLSRNKKTETLTIEDLGKGILAGRLDDDVLSKGIE